MKVAFINEFDIEKNNSAGITVRNLFGEEICGSSLCISVIGDKLKIRKANSVLFYELFNIKNAFHSISFIISEGIDIIYTTGNSPKMLLFLAYVRFRTRIPVLMHYYDNWRETRHPLLSNYLLKCVTGRHENALVIGDMMGSHYRKQYHGNYTTLMIGSIDFCNFNYEKELRQEFRFLYVGGFHLGRVEALLDFEKCLKENHRNDLRLEIVTFKSDYEKNANRFDPRYTSFQIDIPHSEIELCYRKVDALLFVEPAPDEYLLFLKYSMSTKIPEYLASGLPILCIAKQGIAPFEYFKNSKTAIMASNKDEINKAIVSITDKHSSEILEMIERAKETAKRDFNREAQRKILFTIMYSILNER